MIKYLDITNEILQSYVDAGLITKRRHPIKPLNIYCYSRKCEIENAWDDITMKCRGLILDDDNRLVFRCVPKFFNDNQPIGSQIYNQIFNPFSSIDYVVTEKMDGSAIWVVNDSKHGLVVASKTSFESDQAQWAERMILDSKLDQSLIPNISHSLELIVPENRIVVDYGDARELVLWAMVDNAYPEREINIYNIKELFCNRAKIIAQPGENKIGRAHV